MSTSMLHPPSSPWARDTDLINARQYTTFDKKMHRMLVYVSTSVSSRTSYPDGPDQLGIVLVTLYHDAFSNGILI